MAEGGGKESDAIEGMEIATRSKGESCPLCESATFISTFKSQNSAKMSAKSFIFVVVLWSDKFFFQYGLVCMCSFNSTLMSVICTITVQSLIKGQQKGPSLNARFPALLTPQMDTRLQNPPVVL